ncbi:MAG: hypothetical protein ACRD4U_10820, partial [Candidatus Acidiferrales bacterium]
QIPLAAIVHIEPTRNPLSSPAWSPACRRQARPPARPLPPRRPCTLDSDLARRQQAFLLELVSRDPALQLSGDRLARKAS